jgi:uncharacterized membrane protein
MNQYEMVVLIVFIVMLAGVLNRRAHRRKTTPGQKNEEDVKARLAQLDALEERVRVLEKIVTDRRFDLHQEFRDLGS